MFRGLGSQPKIAIIFAGSFKHRNEPGEGRGKIKEDEERELNRIADIDWYFQPKAWASPRFTLAWLKYTFGPELRRLGVTRQVMLIADNLAGQDARFSAGPVGVAAAEAAEEIGVRWWNTVDGCTDAIQPVTATAR